MASSSFFSLPLWLQEILEDRFKKYLILGLCLLGLVVSFSEQRQPQKVEGNGQQVVFFFQPQCPHCLAQKEFNRYLKAKYPDLLFVEYDASLPENGALLGQYIQERKIPVKGGKARVPITFVGPYTVSGFDGAETSGVRLEKAIQAYMQDDPSIFATSDHQWQQEESITLPILGEIRPTDYSLPALAVIIGFVDGFNPCAMWVLVYLISLIMTIEDRRKVWFLVGSFVAASGILYFLFMTAWLNVFLFIGYIRFLTLIIGLAALGVGVLHVREYVQTKGALVCKIGDAQSKAKTRGRIAEIVKAPLNFAAVVNIIILAFIINSVEFACSAALPAIFTHTLSLYDLDTLHYYGYILLYDFFFMLDDLIIFSLAVLALDTEIGHRYAKYCRLLGGIVLFVLGGLMIFQPELLR